MIQHFYSMINIIIFTARKRLIEKTKKEDGSNGTDARIRGKEYYSTKNGVIYTIYLKRLRAGRKNVVFL